jgi:2-polyprenyl-3-methyl-5-hydroxy-6-metoxy-1,4-benzoquinol methylase
MATIANTQIPYVLGNTSSEYSRLLRQASLISKLTEHFLEQVALAPGMRVLDVGSGVGDMALLAAQAVGSSGRVVCIDSDASALSIAQERAARAGLTNMTFQVCDFCRYEAPELHDALIGRCVLLHQPDPEGTLIRLVRNLSRGGLVAFQEPWFSRAFSCPEAPLFQTVVGWLHETVHKSGLEADIGVRLPWLYEAAGLPRPKLSFEMLVDCTAESELYELCVDTVRSLLPRIVALGVSTAEEVQLETLTERLKCEARQLRAVIGVMPLVGAWTNKP